MVTALWRERIQKSSSEILGRGEGCSNSDQSSSVRKATFASGAGGVKERAAWTSAAAVACSVVSDPLP